MSVVNLGKNARLLEFYDDFYIDRYEEISALMHLNPEICALL